MKSRKSALKKHSNTVQIAHASRCFLEKTTFFSFFEEKVLILEKKGDIIGLQY